MDLKEFIYKTAEDTVEFLRVHIKMLVSLKDKTENKDKKEGIQDCIDILENSCTQGLKTARMYAEKREQQMNELMMEEFCSAPIDNCGKDKN